MTSRRQCFQYGLNCCLTSGVVVGMVKILMKKNMCFSTGSLFLWCFTAVERVCALIGFRYGQLLILLSLQCCFVFAAAYYIEVMTDKQSAISFETVVCAVSHVQNFEQTKQFADMLIILKRFHVSFRLLFCSCKDTCHACFPTCFLTLVFSLSRLLWWNGARCWNLMQ